MSAINRKEFLRLSSLGAIAALLPFQQVQALNFISGREGFDPTDYNEAKELARQAKILFFQGDHAGAETKYLRCIELAPADIRFYDNLQDVYAVQKRYLEQAILFKNGLDANPTKIAFYDRLGKTLMRLAVGHKQAATSYGAQFNSNDLLADAEALYLQAINIDPTKQYLNVGLEKVRFKIQNDATNVNASFNDTFQTRRKQNRTLSKSRYESLDNQQLIDALNKIDTKKRNTLYIQSDIDKRGRAITREKKAIYGLLVERLWEGQDYASALIHAQARYDLDKTDARSMRYLARLYRRTNDYGGFISLKREYNDLKNTVWSQLGLMKAIEVAYKKNTPGVDLNEAEQIGLALLGNADLKDVHRVSTTLKLTKIQLELGHVDQARNHILSLVNENRIKGKRLKRAIAIAYIKSFHKTEDYETVRDLAKVALRQKVADANVGAEIVTKKLTKNLKKYKQRVAFEYQLYRAFNGLGNDRGKQRTLQRILRKYPDNKFALKRTK